MSYKHKSGAEKRKLKMKKEIENEKQHKFLKKFMNEASTMRVTKPDSVDSSNATGTELSKHLPGEEASSSNSTEEITENMTVSESFTTELTSTVEQIGPSTGNIQSYSNDIAFWPLNITEKVQEYFIRNPPPQIFGNLESSKKECIEGNISRNRQIYDTVFKRQNHEEILNRDWLVYTSTTKKLYCYICKLFGKVKNNMTEGYDDWKNVHSRLSEHEHSKDHMSAICTFVIRSRTSGRIDIELIKTHENQKNYWRDVLKRVVSTIKFLTKHGLAFLGDNQNLFSKNNGNFLGSLEYLSEYDPFLAKHLQNYGNPGKGNVSYLSSSICDEFICLMSNKLKTKFISEIKEAKYFSIIVDSTPDISHIDQLTLIIRYVLPNCDIVERFFEFIPIYSHTGENLEKIIIEKLENFGLDIHNCRGQSYDNAANMSGQYQGLQSRIKQRSSSAHYIPCSSHSLNLIGNYAAESCLDSKNFFDLVENIYVFLSGSTHRWAVLQNCFESKPHLTVKRLSSTRWSSRHDAVRSLKNGSFEIKKALTILSEDPSQKKIAQIEALELIKKMNSLEFAVFIIIWDKILGRFNAVSLSFQDPTATFNITNELFLSLEHFITNLRNNFNECEKEALIISDIKEYKAKRVSKRKSFFDEGLEEQVYFKERDHFRINVYFAICDTILNQVKIRSEAYKNIYKNFQCFLDKNLSPDCDLNLDDLKSIYRSDISEDVDDEMKHFLYLIRSTNINSPAEMLQLIKSTNISGSFPNVEKLLKIFLTLPVSNASGERSFSALKRVKNYLRNSLLQSKLTAFSILHIECEEAQILDCDELIEEFAAQKSRKISL